jgi:hypothetical protein
VKSKNSETGRRRRRRRRRFVVPRPDSPHLVNKAECEPLLYFSQLFIGRTELTDIYNFFVMQTSSSLTDGIDPD